jgi:hypothetical protein
MAILAFLERQTATQVIRVNGASTVETFPLLNPAIALTIPARTHVRAAYLVTRDAIDCQHLALIATNPHLWFRHQRTPAFNAAPMATKTPINVAAIYRTVVIAICRSLRRWRSG